MKGIINGSGLIAKNMTLDQELALRMARDAAEAGLRQFKGMPDYDINNLDEEALRLIEQAEEALAKVIGKVTRDLGEVANRSE